jgi:hypothetical protein
MKSKILVLMLVVGAVLVSGCTSGNMPAGGGNRSGMDNFTAKALEWLATPEGQQAYPGAGITNTIVIYDENGSEFIHIVPVLNSDYKHLGFLQYINLTDAPESYTKYDEPRDSMYSVNRGDAYAMLMMRNSTYLPGQVKEPVLVSRKGLGTYWMSEVVVNDEVVDKMYEEVSLY